MTLGSPSLPSVPRHHRPAHPERGDSSVPGHQPGQPGLPAHPAAGWGWAWHLQQGQGNTPLQRWEAAFAGVSSSSGTTKAELQDHLGSEISWCWKCWKSVINSCFLLPWCSPLSPMPDLPCHGFLSRPQERQDQQLSCRVQAVMGCWGWGVRFSVGP